MCNEARVWKSRSVRWVSVVMALAVVSDEGEG